MRNHSNENDFDLHENGREGGTHFHMKGFARRLGLKKRQRVTWKWPIMTHSHPFSRLFASAAWICFEFQLINCIVYVLCDWPE